MIIQVLDDDIKGDNPLETAINRALEKKRTKIRVKVGTMWVHISSIQSIMLPWDAYKWNVAHIKKQPVKNFKFELKYDFENNRHT